MDLDGYRKSAETYVCDVFVRWGNMNLHSSFAEVNTSQSSGSQKERDERKREWMIV